jgi:hypothetical protein
MYIISERVEVSLDGKRYLLEVGDRIMINEKMINGREVEYPVNDKEHTQSAIGYIMKYKDRDDESGEKARRNMAKVARAAKRFGIDLPDGWHN